MANRVDKDGVVVKTSTEKLERKLAEHLGRRDDARRSTLDYARSLGTWATFVADAEKAARFTVADMTSLQVMVKTKSGDEYKDTIRSSSELLGRIENNEFSHAERVSVSYEDGFSIEPVARYQSGKGWLVASEAGTGTGFSSSALEHRLVELGAAPSDEKLRRAVGLDFDMKVGGAIASLDDVQSQRYLRDALCRISDEGEGEAHAPRWPEELPEALGRGLVTKHELSFIIDGIEASRQTGRYQIATEHVDKFKNKDVLVSGQGIQRVRSTAAEKRKDETGVVKTVGQTLVEEGSVKLPGGGRFTYEEAVAGTEEFEEYFGLGE